MLLHLCIPPPTPAPSIAHGLVMSEPILVTIMLTSFVYLSQLYATTLRQPNIYLRPILGEKGREVWRQNCRSTWLWPLGC